MHLIFLETSGEITYVHLAVTHFLVAAGVLIAVFLNPPLRASRRGIQAGDWRLSALSAGALVLFVVLTYIPLAQELLKIGPLHGMEDYATVAGLVLAWAFVLLVSWRIIPGARKRQQ